MRNSARVQVPVLLTPEERERLRKGARLDGLKLGPWMRMVALREAVRRETEELAVTPQQAA
jgi:hypothetical protein